MTKPKQPWQCQKCSGLGKIIPRATPRSTICAWCADELKKAGHKLAQRRRWLASLRGVQ